MSDLKEEMVKLEQQNVVINEDKVKKQCSKMPNWKAPRHDGVQEFWIKRLEKMYERIAAQLNEILEGTKEIPSWMTYGRTVLCQKDPVKRNSVENFRPTICLALMRKLLTCIISDDIKAYYSVPHSWILKRFDMLGIADNIRRFFGEKYKQVESSFEFKWVGFMRG